MWKYRQGTPNKPAEVKKINSLTSNPAAMLLMIILSTFMIFIALVLNIKGIVQVSANPYLQGFVIANLIYDSISITLYPLVGAYSTLRSTFLLRKIERKRAYIILHIFYALTYIGVLWVASILPRILNMVI